MVEESTSEGTEEQSDLGAPGSLGDAAKAGRDPVVSEGDDVPDPENTQTREG